MSAHRPHVRITLHLPSADYGALVSAARNLRRIMGKMAPDALALAHFNLHDRDAVGLADDYLDAIRWPSAKGRTVSLGRGRRSKRRP